jgi:DDE superfamily endonuclease
LIHVILDNYGSHKHPKVRSWLARHPRWTFHFTPTSASWLNAVEGFFAKLTRRRLKRGVFRSLVDLQAAINRFLAEHNRSPKPFVWTADPDRIIAAASRGYQALCVDDPVEARAIWYGAPRSGAVMCPAYVARPYDRWP